MKLISGSGLRPSGLPLSSKPGLRVRTWRATALFLTGAVVNVWLRCQEYSALLDVLREQIQVSQTLLNLTELRFSVGTDSAVNVLQQRQQLSDTQAQVPRVRALLETALNQLAVLLGRVPGSLDELAPGRSLPALPPFPQLVSPAVLLVSRPDLQAAQRRLQSADYRVAAAVAERLPRLVLQLSYEFSARSWGHLLSARDRFAAR